MPSLSKQAQQASKYPKVTVMMRPGVADVSAGSVWIFGLPPDIAQGGIQEQTPSASSIVDVVDLAFGLVAGSSESPLHSTAQVLQRGLRPTECTARWVDATHWSADRVACQLDGGCPLIICGDAAMGKPFFTGSTLNRHLWDMCKLIDEVDWTHDGSCFSGARFEAHERRYQEAIRRIPEFQRRCIPVPPLSSPPADISDGQEAYTLVSSRLSKSSSASILPRTTSPIRQLPVLL
jgi:2-polyprenyl-6-methoxyphenol hydroxylase-like FAD-dependent oxidoreductase